MNLDLVAIFGQDTYDWVVFPLIIFSAKILDVSFGTLRMIFVARGMRKLAPAVSFFQILIWIMTLGVIMTNLSNIMGYIAYAGGFALGTYIGMMVDRKLSLGTVNIRIVTRKKADELVTYLKKEGYSVTTVDAQGNEEPVTIIYIDIDRRDMEVVSEAIKRLNPNAFYTVEDIRSASEGIQPHNHTRFGRHIGFFGPHR